MPSGWWCSHRSLQFGDEKFAVFPQEGYRDRSVEVEGRGVLERLETILNLIQPFTELIGTLAFSGG